MSFIKGVLIVACGYCLGLLAKEVFLMGLWIWANS